MFSDGTRRYDEIIPGNATDLSVLIPLQLPPRYTTDLAGLCDEQHAEVGLLVERPRQPAQDLLAVSLRETVPNAAGAVPGVCSTSR